MCGEWCLEMAKMVMKQVDKAFITGVKYVAHRMKLLSSNKHKIVYNKDPITLSVLMNLWKRSHSCSFPLHSEFKISAVRHSNRQKNETSLVGEK